MLLSGRSQGVETAAVRAEELVSDTSGTESFKAGEQAVEAPTLQAEGGLRVVVQHPRIVKKVVLLIANAQMKQHGGRHGEVVVQALAVGMDERSAGGGDWVGEPF